MTIEFHIRKRLARRRGNQWYADRSVRTPSTFCGAAVTDHDVSWNDRAKRFDQWVPCEICVVERTRANERRTL